MCEEKGMEFISNITNVLTGKIEEYKADFHQWINVLYKADEWTKFMLADVPMHMTQSVIQEALKRTYKQNYVEIKREYYNLDCYVYQSFYDEMKKKDEAEGMKKVYEPMCWKMLAAIEHENDYKTWTDELVKLCFIKAPLKVLIAYSAWPETAAQYAERLLKKLYENASFSMSDEEEYYILFGKRSGNGKDESKKNQGKPHCINLKKLHSPQEFLENFFVNYKVVLNNGAVSVKRV